MQTILIADDHPIIRSGIKLLLKDHFGLGTIIYEAGNGDQIIEVCKRHKVYLVLMDLNMPFTDSQNVVRTLVAMQPEIRILVLTVNKEEIFGPLYLKLGVKGFVSKESGEPELLEAVTAVMKGEIYTREDMKAFYVEHIIRDDPYGALTKRELEILRRLAGGEAVGHIAGSLNLGTTTVSTHKANIFEKLQVSNLIQLKLLTDIYPL